MGECSKSRMFSGRQASRPAQRHSVGHGQTRTSATHGSIVFVCAMLSMILLHAPCAFAATVHVPSGQATLQAGIDAASNGDTVLVAPGIYSGSGNEGVLFHGKRIHLLSESGQSNTTLLTTTAVRTILLTNHEDSLAVVDGFTITGGLDSSFTWTGSYHGGILVDSSAPLIRNCTITGCYAANGGGVDIKSGSAPALVNCLIYRNFASALGGGVRSYARGVVIDHCRVVGNRSAGWAGGGMVVAGNIRVTNSIVSLNKVTGASVFHVPGFGGGICGFDPVDLVIDSSNVAHNSSSFGGAVAVIGGSLTMTYSSIYNNVASDSYAGVLVDVRGPADVEGLSVSHCTFACNYAANVGADGVAVRGLSQGAAEANVEDLPRMTSRAPAGAGTFDISNSIFAFNSSAGVGQFGLVQTLQCSANDVWNVVAGPNYGGNLTEQTGSNSNIMVDPLFCSVSDSGLTIDQASPCHGSGTLSSNMGAHDAVCNNYASRLPTRLDIPNPAGTYAATDSIASALSRALPWDTLYFPSASYQLSNNIVINKPLYLLGRGQDYSTLWFNVWGAIGMTLSTFCVVESLHVDAMDISPDQFSIGVLCQAPAILFDCMIFASGWMNRPRGLVLDAAHASPYLRQCALANGNSWVLAQVLGEQDVVAPMNYWEDLSDSIRISQRIVDSRRSPGPTWAGTVFYVPFRTSMPTGVEQGEESPPIQSFKLEPNYPNPFNPSTTMSFSLPRASEYTLAIYNVLGQRVKEFSGYAKAGRVSVVWDASRMASGVYLYRLTAGSFTDSRKMILLK